MTMKSNLPTALACGALLAFTWAAVSAQESIQREPLPSPTPEAQNPASDTAPSTPSAPATESAAEEEFSQKILPPPPSPQPRVIPTRHGDTTGEVWIGHRAVVERYAGWGWIRREREPWSRARWVMIEEDPGQRMAPGRFHARPTQDDNTQYRLYGTLADYKGYEPNFDVFVDVFRIQGWETIGPAPRPKLSPPRSSNSSSQGRWSERGANLPR
jgi:hypothetical protein